MALLFAAVLVVPGVVAVNRYYHKAHSSQDAYAAALKTNWPFPVFFRQTLPGAKLQIANMQDDFFRADYIATTKDSVVTIVEKPVAQITAGGTNPCAIVTSFGGSANTEPATPCTLIGATTDSKLYADQVNYYFDYKGTRVQIDQTELSSVVSGNAINGLARSPRLDQAAINVVNTLTGS